MPPKPPQLPNPNRRWFALMTPSITKRRNEIVQGFADRYGMDRNDPAFYEQLLFRIVDDHFLNRPRGRPKKDAKQSQRSTENRGARRIWTPEAYAGIWQLWLTGKELLRARGERVTQRAALHAAIKQEAPYLHRDDIVEFANRWARRLSEAEKAPRNSRKKRS